MSDEMSGIVLYFGFWGVVILFIIASELWG